MTPAQRIHQLERDNAKLRQQVETQTRTVEKYRRQFMGIKRRLAKERGRSVPMQELINWLRARNAELEDPKGQAERFFKDGET
ncbi:MAG: hypothetical protein GOVbin2937_52 [Prokaryotic dsDNA virus sp.]|uniref:hypothetical protein n=1 Tax=Sulfitobacter sp. 1A13353 TaxID=3368568 RepID=UPI00118C2F57|nr:MAG: hypothetical protein GOVbin2937_52 [Prokaryotic dsDNA virus sp.]|tara:strand:- start:9143 stop:9391 length:249 start_codon:yes stop_codon:yes gene_type:complete